MITIPSQAYKKFYKNLETVERLIETYNQARKSRGTKGRAALDHITRSAIVFMVSSFEVYCEDILFEGVQKSAKIAKDAIYLPHSVKKYINDYVRNEKNGIPPIYLCDEGWRKEYVKIAGQRIKYLNTPDTKNLKTLFNCLMGVPESKFNCIEQIEKIDKIISFRGEIVHQVKATKYVSIEETIDYKVYIQNVVIALDLMVRDHIKNTYGVKAPWNDTYIPIA